jgi:hypothetical protein
LGVVGSQRMRRKLQRYNKRHKKSLKAEAIWNSGKI